MVKNVRAGAQVLVGSRGLRRIVSTASVMAPDLSDKAEEDAWGSTILHIRPSQLRYLHSLSRTVRSRIEKSIFAAQPACIVLTGGEASGEFLERAEAANIPVLKTKNLKAMTRALMDAFSREASVHGVLVQIFGMGTLLLGSSAVGKSEVALDLVLRGHRLVADDVVLIKKMEGDVYGRSTELGANLLQIRGVGIIDLRSLYGDTATIPSSKIGLVVELAEWQKGHPYALIGLQEYRYRLLDVNVPYLKLPVKAGRNMATLIEVGVRNQMMKQQGIFTARDLGKKLKKRLAG